MKNIVLISLIIAIAFTACKKEEPVNKTLPPPPPAQQYGTVIFEVYFQWPQNSTIGHNLGIHHDVIDASNNRMSNIVDRWTTYSNIAGSTHTYVTSYYADVTRYYNYRTIYADSSAMAGIVIENKINSFYVIANDTVIIRDTIKP